MRFMLVVSSRGTQEEFNMLVGYLTCLSHQGIIGGIIGLPEQKKENAYKLPAALGDRSLEKVISKINFPEQYSVFRIEVLDEDMMEKLLPEFQRKYNLIVEYYS